MHEPDWPAVTHEPAWDLAPAADVRRRGEVLARRRRGRASIAGLVLSAVVVGAPFAGGWGSQHLAADPTPSAPRPAQSSPPAEGTWLESVPEGFALGAGMPGESRSEARRDVPICDGESWATAQPGLADTAAMTAPGGSRAPSEMRVLLVYRNELWARDAASSVRRVAASCDSLDSGGQMIVLGGDAGVVDESWGYSYAPRGAGADDGRVLLVLRVGNSVLLSTYARESGSAPAVDDGVPSQVLQTARALCVFAEDPC